MKGLRVCQLRNIFMAKAKVLIFFFFFFYLLLSACCSVPFTGPSSSYVINLDSAETNDQNWQSKVMVVDVDDATMQNLSLSAPSYSLREFHSQAAYTGAVQVGDVLDITIWESPPAVLLGGALNSAGSGNAQTLRLPEQMVNQSGRISVPFIGAVNVSGKQPEVIQNEIKSRLKRMANQPQVMVRLAQNNSANVSVIQAGKSVRMPLTARGERVLDAVAAAGGVAERVQDVSVQLTRGELVRTVPFERLLADGRENVLLHSHDVVTLLAKPMSFTALGAVAKPQQIGFAQGNMSLSQALGQMGGLLDRRSDAKGVFVFRYEPLAELHMVKQEQWLAKGYDRQALIPVAYRVNLLDVGSLLRIQRFEVKNKDIVYVANAPLSEFQKFMQIIFSPVIGGVSSVDNIGN